MFIVLFGMPISCLTWDVALRFQHNGALAALVYSDAHGTSFISGSVNYRPFAHPRSDFQIPLVRVDRAILQFLNTPNEWMVTITPSSQPWLQFFHSIRWLSALVIYFVFEQHIFFLIGCCWCLGGNKLFICNL